MGRSGAERDFLCALTFYVRALACDNRRMDLILSRWTTALVAFCLCVGTTAGSEKAQNSRRSPVVRAVQRTKQAIVIVLVPSPHGGKDRVGAGVIVDEGGTIVTNHHVVETCKAPRVELYDGTVFRAEVLFASASSDLAVLRIDAGKKLFFLELAPTSDLMVGETVIAVGHPLGFQNTVSVGIISAVDRKVTMPSGEVLIGLIQTDAAINPGNSGGPLLNINGEFIGMNCVMRHDARGIAFAINAGTISGVLKKVLLKQPSEKGERK